MPAMTYEVSKKRVVKLA